MNGYFLTGNKPGTGMWKTRKLDKLAEDISKEIPAGGGGLEIPTTYRTAGVDEDTGMPIIKVTMSTTMTFDEIADAAKLGPVTLVADNYDEEHRTEDLYRVPLVEWTKDASLDQTTLVFGMTTIGGSYPNVFPSLVGVVFKSGREEGDMYIKQLQ